MRDLNYALKQLCKRNRDGSYLDQGGRARGIPIRNEEQRRLLKEAKRFAGRGSLIPADQRYVEQLRRFEDQCARAGIHRVHGHRHQYAQTRYRELTGWAAPAAGRLIMKLYVQ